MLNSVHRIRPAIHTCASPPCSWPVSMVFSNRIDPGEPTDKDLYDLPAEEAKIIKQVPASLSEVLDALEAITNSCFKAMSSHRIFSKPTSPTSVKLKSIRSAFARTLRIHFVFRLLIRSRNSTNRLGVCLLIDDRRPWSGRRSSYNTKS